MTGGDQITARLLYRNNISFMPSFKLFMATNHRPYIQDDSVLQSHRIRVIPFNRHFSAEEQDRTLKDALKDPKVQSALLNRCIYGFVQYLEKGLNEPKSVIDATSAYKSATEILELFLQDNFISSVDGLIALSSFYEQYTDWCEGRNIIPLPKRKISVSLRTKGILRSSATINGKTVRNVVKGYCSKAVVSTVKKNNSISVTTVSDTSTETLAKPHEIPILDLHLRHNGSPIPHKPYEAVLIKNNTATSNDDDDPIFDANGNLMDPITPKEG
jgi:putative DNA primase/helicase